MKEMSNRSKSIVILGFLLLIGGWVAYQLLAPSLIEDIVNGESIAPLNDLLRGRGKYDLAYYLNRGNKIFYQSFALVTIGYLIIVGALIPQQYTQRLWNFLKDFFNTPYYPVSLAVFRIGFYMLMVYFAIDWASGPQDAANVVWWSRVPSDLRFAPPGLGLILEYLPINPEVARFFATVFVISCITTLIGLFSRTSAMISVLSGLYVLGLPQFFGTINHYQHLIWFGILLALSPCGDVLSIDSIFLARNRAKKGELDPPPASNRYGMPLRFAWILIGIMYFFPGYWKWWESGLEWALSNNLQMHLYKKWFTLGGFDPLIPVHNYALLYQGSALLTLFFEVGFIFLIFFPRVRWIALVNGQLFHIMTLILMGIPFIDLQVCYVVFFEWKNGFTRMGNWLFKNERFVIYNHASVASRQKVAVLKAQDVFERVVYIDMKNSKLIKQYNLEWVDKKEAENNIIAIKGKESYQGTAVYRALLRYIPALIFIYPILLIESLQSGLAAIYDQFLDSRFDWTPKKIQVVMWTGAFLFVSNTILGFGRIHSWPLSAYPTFQAIQGPETTGIVMEAFTADGQIIAVDNEVTLKSFTDDRFFAMVTRIFNDYDASGDLEARNRKLLAIWGILAESNPDLEGLEIERVVFYKNTYTIVPEELHLNPLSQEMVAEFSISEMTESMSGEVANR